MSLGEMLSHERERPAGNHKEHEKLPLRRILRLPEVERVTGRRRSAIYEGVAEETFPAPVPLGARAVGWLEDEVAAWIEHRVVLRDERRKEQN
jgi:prophage regulatory protein